MMARNANKNVIAPQNVVNKTEVKNANINFW